MRSCMSPVLIAVTVLSSAEPGCCAGFNRRDRNLDHGRHRTAQPGRLDVAVRPLLHRVDLGPRPGAGCWSPAEPGTTHRECGAAGHGPGPERELRRLSSRAEHGTLVGPTRRPSVVALAGRRLCPARAGRHRSRRYDRAPLGNEDQGARYLPGPGPLQSRSLRQGEWSALAVRHAARAHSLGRLRLGAAVPDHPGAFRTLRTEAGPA